MRIRTQTREQSRNPPGVGRVFGKQAAQIPSVVAIRSNQRAVLEALRLERGGEAIMGNANAALAAIGTHGMQRIAQPDGHHDQRDGAQHTVASTASRREGLPLVSTSPISNNGVSKKKGCM